MPPSPWAVGAVTCALLLSVSSAIAQNQAAAPPVDTILMNGQVYAADGGWTQAVAIAQGVIVAVGDDATVMQLKGAGTQVLDLKQATVLPGFHDMHMHPLGGGNGLSECRLIYGSTPDQIGEQVKACAARSKPGEWIVGRGWANAVFEGKVQDRRLLDQASPRNPIFLSDETGHSGWVNGLALERAGITRDTANPFNGVIERDAKGEPTGVLRESAMGLVRQTIPPYTAAQNVEGMKRAYEHILSQGITALQEASGSASSLTAMATLADANHPQPRVKACLRWTYNPDGPDTSFEALYASRGIYRRAMVKPDCVKIMLDGVPNDGQTAALLDPYEHPLSEDRKLGILTAPPEVVAREVTRFDKDGMSMMIHCTGDRCARVAVDGIAAARRANGYSGVLHQIAHSNLATLEDLRRGRQLGASFEFSSYLYYWNAQTKTYFDALGPKRFVRYKPLREAIDAGALVLEGSDWPVAFSTNPWIALETLVTREQPGGGGEKLAPSQAITLKEAVDIYTVNAARQFGHADSVGQIRTGYQADLIVIDRNIFNVPITTVHDTKVLMTLVNGKQVYKSQ